MSRFSSDNTGNFLRGAWGAFALTTGFLISPIHILT